MKSIQRSKINSCLKLNKLSLNADKTKFMTFYTNQRMIPPIALSINRKPTAQVSTFNFLGILLIFSTLYDTVLLEVGNYFDMQRKHGRPQKLLYVGTSLNKF